MADRSSTPTSGHSLLELQTLLYKQLEWPRLEAAMMAVLNAHVFKKMFLVF